MQNFTNPARRRVLGALGAGIAAAAFAPRLRAAAPASVRLGVATAGGGNPITWGGSPGSVARLNRWLEEALEPQGIKVEWLFFKGAGPAVNEALSNRQIDFAYQGDLPAVAGRANGLDTRILVASGARNNLYLVTPPDSDIRSIADLKGRTVSIFRGTNGHLVAINILAAHGLTERDIKGVNLDTGSAQAAIASNGVEAAFGGQEWFKLRDQGLARIVYSTQGQDPRFTRQAHLLGREAFINEHPDVAQRIVDVFVRAADWASDEANRDELFRLWARSGVPYESFVAEFENQQLAVRNSPLIDDFIRARYAAVVEDALKLRLIRREVSVDDWFEPRFLNQALASTNLGQRWTAFAADGKAHAPAVARS